MLRYLRFFAPSIIMSLFILQTNAQIVYCEGDSIQLNALNYTTGNVQWEESSDGGIIWQDIAGANGLTCMVYPVAPVWYRLRIMDTTCLPYFYTTVQYANIITQPSVAMAGSNQLNVPGNTCTLSASTPTSGTGQWNVQNGTGGNFIDPYNPSTTFSGNPGIVYTLRWTVSNPCGSYSDDIQVSFVTTFTCGDTLTDVRDGQKYPTLLIGNQCWLKSNLNYGQQLAFDVTQTNNGVIEKYCYDDLVSNCNNLGGLYIWNEAMQYSTTESVQGICPAGWHMPSDGEWKTLEMALGMTQAEADMSNTWRGTGIGTALKTGGSSGFEAKLGGGLWGAAGSYMFVNNMYYVWTSTESSSTNAWRRCLSATDDKVGRWDTFPKDYGFAVRCVKN